MQGKQTLYKSTDPVPIRWYRWHHYENYEQLLIYTGIIPIQSLLKYTRAELASENIIKGLKGIMQDDMTCQKIKVDQKSENVQFCIFANGNILHHKTCFYLAPTKKKRKNWIKYTAKKNFGCKQKIPPISSIQYMSFIYIKGYHL